MGDRPELEAELASFLAACRVVDIIQGAKKKLYSLREAGKELKTGQCRAMRLHKAAYGTGYIKPKHHWMFDIGEQFEMDADAELDVVMDQLVIERLHLTVRPHAERTKNTRRFSHSVLSGVLNSQLATLQEMESDCCILDKVKVKLDGYDHAELGDNMQVMGMHVSVGDLVFHNDVVGKVCGCVCELGVLFAIVRPCQLVRVIYSSCSQWRLSGELVVWRAHQLEQADFFITLGS